jgi:hypothetical protein
MQISRAGEYGVLGLMNLARRAPGEMAMIIFQLWVAVSGS